ncbi:MAG: hypothetical protein N3C63_10145 [Rhodocyclaceae bacterium]|nr:hypothetical protein [Rhodocyclaceae bacterium]
MKRAWVWIIGLLVSAAWAGQDFNCMQGCLGQGYDRGYCAGVCATGPAGGSLLDQPGLPKNPAFEQVKPEMPRQRPPRIADPKCMKECQRRGHDYMFCYKRMCSYSLD